MSLHTDLKFFNIISGRLENVHRADSYVFRFRCPICGDSVKNKAKTRGYVYRNGDKLGFTCHNCNSPIGFSGFLKFIDRSIWNEYVVENFLEKKAQFPETKKVIAHDPVVEKCDKIVLPYRKLSELPSNHRAVEWFRARKIPEKYLEEFYFLEKFSDLRSYNDVTALKVSKKASESRIIIPYFSEENKLIGMACREIGNETTRKYVNIKFIESSMVYGLDRLDKGKPVYVVEGPIDSLFLDNCIALGGLAFSKLRELGLKPSQVIMVYDDQPKNAFVVEALEKAIRRGYNVVIWGSGNALKMDINDLVINGFDPLKIIRERTFSGLLAELEFINWRKV